MSTGQQRQDTRLTAGMLGHTHARIYYYTTLTEHTCDWHAEGQRLTRVMTPMRSSSRLGLRDGRRGVEWPDPGGEASAWDEPWKEGGRDARERKRPPRSSPLPTRLSISSALSVVFSFSSCIILSGHTITHTRTGSEQHCSAAYCTQQRNIQTLNQKYNYIWYRNSRTTLWAGSHALTFISPNESNMISDFISVRFTYWFMCALYTHQYSKRHFSSS